MCEEPPHFSFQCPIESFDHGLFKLGFHRKLLNVIVMEEALHGAAFKLQTLVCLQLYRLLTLVEYFSECPNHVLRSLALHGLGPAPSAEHVNHSQKMLCPIHCTGRTLPTHKTRLPLVVDTTRGIVTRRITLTRWLVERV